MAIFALPCRSKRCSTVRGSKISPCWVRFGHEAGERVGHRVERDVVVGEDDRDQVADSRGSERRQVQVDELRRAERGRCGREVAGVRGAVLEAQGGVVALAAHAPAGVVEQDAQVEVHAPVVRLRPVQEQAQRVRVRQRHPAPARDGVQLRGRRGAAGTGRSGPCRCSSSSTVSSGSSRAARSISSCWMAATTASMSACGIGGRVSSVAYAFVTSPRGKNTRFGSGRVRARIEAIAVSRTGVATVGAAFSSARDDGCAEAQQVVEAADELAGPALRQLERELGVLGRERLLELGGERSQAHALARDRRGGAGGEVVVHAGAADRGERQRRVRVPAWNSYGCSFSPIRFQCRAWRRTSSASWSCGRPSRVCSTKRRIGRGIYGIGFGALPGRPGRRARRTARAARRSRSSDAGGRGRTRARCRRRAPSSRARACGPGTRSTPQRRTSVTRSSRSWGRAASSGRPVACRRGRRWRRGRGRRPAA